MLQVPQKILISDTVGNSNPSGTLPPLEQLTSAHLPSFGQLCDELMQPQPKEKIEKLELPSIYTQQTLPSMASSFVLNPNRVESAFSLVPPIMPMNVLYAMNTNNESNMLNTAILPRPVLPYDYSTLLSLNPNMLPYLTNLSSIPNNYVQLPSSFEPFQSIPQMPSSSTEIVNTKRKRKPPGQLCCTCSSTSCMKSYCVCYKAGRLCGASCTCVKCKNGSSNLQAVRNLTMKTKRSFLDEYSICRCTRECRQKYCDCRKRGMTCSQQCGCENCRNYKQQLPIPIDEIDPRLDSFTPDAQKQKRARRIKTEIQNADEPQNESNDSLRLLVEAANMKTTEQLSSNPITYVTNTVSESSHSSPMRTPTISPLSSDRV